MTRQNSWNFDTTYTVGDVLYADTTSTLTKLNPGSDGEVLTLASGVPTWAAGGGGGALVYISTATASSSSEITFTGLSSSYYAYKIIWNNVAPATDNVIFRFRTSSNAGVSYDSGASDYDYQGTPSFDQTSYILLGGSLGSSANEIACGDLLLINPSASNRTICTYTSTYYSRFGSFTVQQGGGSRRAADIVDAVQFTMDSGNIATGTFKLYGLLPS